MKRKELHEFSQDTSWRTAFHIFICTSTHTYTGCMCICMRSICIYAYAYDGYVYIILKHGIIAKLLFCKYYDFIT